MKTKKNSKIEFTNFPLSFLELSTQNERKEELKKKGCARAYFN